MSSNGHAKGCFENEWTLHSMQFEDVGQCSVMSIDDDLFQYLAASLRRHLFL